MISAVLLINAKGDIVISRVYRDDDTINSANSFRMKVIAAKETGSDPPIKQINKTHFLYIRHRNMFFVAVTTANANASLCFEFLMAMIKIFQVRCSWCCALCCRCAGTWPRACDVGAVEPRVGTLTLRMLNVLTCGCCGCLRVAPGLLWRGL